MFRTDDDRLTWTLLLEDVAERSAWLVLFYVLLGNVRPPARRSTR